MSSAIRNPILGGQPGYVSLKLIMKWSNGLGNAICYAMSRPVCWLISTNNQSLILICTDVRENLLNAHDNTSFTVFNSTRIPAPALNITARYVDDSFFQMNYTDNAMSPFSDSTRRRWASEGQEFDEAYIQNNGSCLSTSVSDSRAIPEFLLTNLDISMGFLLHPT